MYSDRQLREAFHYCFLERLLKISDMRLYVLKGGVNLRFFFHSPRYSEDMDLDVLGGNIATLRKNGYKILQEPAFLRTLRTYGITGIEPNDPTQAKHTETTQRFRVRLITGGGDVLPSKVEFSRRHTAPAPGAVVERVDPEIARRYGKLGLLCQHYSGAAAAVQKVQALAGRSVTQARDLFDLYLLGLGGHADRAMLEQAVPAGLRDEAGANLRTLAYEDYAGQVVEFLEEGSRSEFAARASWNDMVEQVQRLLAAG